MQSSRNGEFENPFGDKARGKSPGLDGSKETKGVFRNPDHAERERTKKNEDIDVKWERETTGKVKKEKIGSSSTLNWFSLHLLKVMVPKVGYKIVKNILI